jgi:hypothetical protein
LRPAIFASVDDAQSFAFQAAEPLRHVKASNAREDYWGGDPVLREESCDSSCSKENILVLLEPKSTRQRYRSRL